MQDFFAGALLGLARGSGDSGASWGRFGHRVNLARFLQVTAVFLLLFVVQLVIYAFLELTEADALPLLDNSVFAHRDRAVRPRGNLRPLAFVWACRDSASVASIRLAAIRGSAAPHN